MSAGQIWTMPNGENFVEAGLEWDDEAGLMTRFIGLTTYPHITLLRANKRSIAERGLVPVSGIKGCSEHQATSLWQSLIEKATK